MHHLDDQTDNEGTETMTSLQSLLNRALPSKPRRDRTEGNARAKARRLADKLGIEIEIDRSPDGNGYWLNDTGWDDENFSTSWTEVVGKLERLARERLQ